MEKRFRKIGQKFALPFYITKLTVRVSPAYLATTVGIAVVAAIGPVLSTWLIQQILSGLLSGENPRLVVSLGGMPDCGQFPQYGHQPLLDGEAGSLFRTV